MLVTPEKQHTIKAFIRRGEKYYVAECLEIAVVTQGKTLDETIENCVKRSACILKAKTQQSLV
jgi:hypothetical protein